MHCSNKKQALDILIKRSQRRFPRGVKDMRLNDAPKENEAVSSPLSLTLYLSLAAAFFAQR